MGSRIRAGGSDLPKPLHEVRGTSLIKRTILALAAGGVDSVAVVVGFRADAVRAALEGDPEYAMRGIRIQIVDNPEYEMANGVSVLAAREHLDGPFLLSMADHVFDASLARRAAGADMSAADLYLCVDYRIDSVYDLDDATKVQSEDGYIRRIGKQLEGYDCVDCGVFAVSPALFIELAAVRAERGDCSLSDGVGRLAARRRARVLDIGDSFWQDVDTQHARDRAERIVGSAQPAAPPATQRVSRARRAL